MPQTIARLYASSSKAEAVAKQLTDEGFSAESVHVVTSAASLPAVGITAAQAAVYEPHLAAGEALVVVQPMFGAAAVATEMMDSHDPIVVDVPVAETYTTKFDWHSPTPLSSWLGWPVLCSEPAPLSKKMKWETLKADPADSKTLSDIRKQSTDSAPLSRKIGMPTLSKDPTPASTKFGWKVLSPEAAPLSKKFGWTILSGHPAPLSERLGWKVLLNDPAPLSRILGMYVLSKRD